MDQAEQLTRARTTQGPVEKAPRPYQLTVELTRDEEAEIDALSPAERLTRYRIILAQRGTLKR